MEKHLDVTCQRLQVFARDSNLGRLIYRERKPVELLVYNAPDRITYSEAMRGVYRPATVGEKFGPLWSTHWFKVGIHIPDEWCGQEVHLLWDSSSEACIYQDGTATQGLTGRSNSWQSDAIRREYLLTKSAKGSERIDLQVEIACNNLFGVEGEPAAIEQVGILRQAEIAVFDRDAWDLYWDFKVIADMAEYLPLNTPRGGQALYTANAMVNAINLDDCTTWPSARAIAADFFASHNGDSQHNISAIGHAHIDTAWLWPIAETKRKCIRTFSSAVRYMEDYPDYKFACSQAQQYDWIKQLQPELYAKIKKMAADGRFIPAGGTWVEMDCNIPSGESLVRQFLFGQRFFQQEFGVRCDEFWEPDVFGYSAALPQIMKEVGIKYFLTQKLSWNQFNKLPDHTFYWEGLDGSRVLAHFPPTDTYNSVASVKEVLFHVNNFKDHERSNESYLLFGYGDGGGGPTTGMLEQIKRMGDFDGLPRVQIRSPKEFFTRCSTNSKELTTWVGELYFELHRGTYTTEARNKLNNRRSEALLHNIEFLSAVAFVLKDAAYPGSELDQMWKTTLTNQFHDIIPGSSITQVYQDSTAQYQAVLAQAAILQDKAIHDLLGYPAERTDNACTINTLGFARTELVSLPPGMPASQTAPDGSPLGVVSAPAMGYAVSKITPWTGSQASLTETAETITLANDYIEAVFKRDGSLISLYDKGARRQCLAAGSSANHFVIFDDLPNSSDAWDVDIFHLEKRYEVNGAYSTHVSEQGPLRVSIEFEYNLSSESTLRQTVSLTAISPRLDFSTQVDWHESHKFLKVEFPFNLHAQNATYEVQYGHLQRPTHYNTSWDLARFEVCAHHWADLAEPDFGVALLNDSKYGYSTHGNIMRLSLLRSPKAPDPIADMGLHAFRYALLPHQGSFQEAGVIEAGHAFNQPLNVFASDAAPAEVSFFNTNHAHVLIDTVKKAEDSNALVVRLYEAFGSRGPVRLSSSLPVKAVTRCNLLEEEDIPMQWVDGGVNFEVTPFKIVTLKIFVG